MDESKSKPVLMTKGVDGSLERNPLAWGVRCYQGDAVFVWADRNRSFKARVAGQMKRKKSGDPCLGEAGCKPCC